MTDSTAVFFDELGRRGHEPLLEKATGTVRFDLVDGEQIEHWLLTLSRGEVSVARENVAADCVVRADRALFDAMLTGNANAMSAFLRGELSLEGDPELLVLLQRVLGAPADRRSEGGVGG